MVFVQNKGLLPAIETCHLIVNNLINKSNKVQKYICNSSNSCTTLEDHKKEEF